MSLAKANYAVLGLANLLDRPAGVRESTVYSYGCDDFVLPAALPEL